MQIVIQEARIMQILPVPFMNDDIPPEAVAALQNHQIHFLSRVLFRVIKAVTPRQPFALGFLISFYLTRWNLRLSSSPQRKRFWIDSNFLASLVGLCNTYK